MDFLISENSPWSHRTPICFLKASQQESSSQHMSLGGQGTSKEPCGWSYTVLVSVASMVGGAVGAQRSLSIIYPTVHQADPRASTLANPYGPCFQFIHLLPQTWPWTKPLLTASTPHPPLPHSPPAPGTHIQLYVSFSPCLSHLWPSPAGWRGSSQSCLPPASASILSPVHPSHLSQSKPD